MGPGLRKRTQEDENLVVMSLVMGYHDLQYFTRIAIGSGCNPGEHFAEYAGGSVIGACPPWLRIRWVPAHSDPLLGLRQETWDSMEPDVREIYEKMKQETVAEFSFVNPHALEAANDA